VTLEVVPAPFGAVMFDCLDPLSQSVLDALASYVLPGTCTGPAIFGRYLENLTADELALIVTHPRRYGLLCIGESRPNGYMPTAEQGQEDGAREVAKYNLLGLPKGGGIVWDAEGLGGSAASATASGTAYGEVLEQNGNQCVTYVGDGVPLTPSQLFALPRTTLYWHSLSNVQQVATCDYAMLQAYPTQTLDLGAAGVRQFDVSFIYRDKLGRGPMIVRGA
jgi:hypothetical protein